MFKIKNSIYLSKSPAMRSIGLSWYQEDLHSKTYSVVKELIFDKIKEGELDIPVTYISYEDAQQFMDELWNCGIRPTAGAGTAGSMAATEKHLDDMRKIVFENFLKDA